MTYEQHPGRKPDAERIARIRRLNDAFRNSLIGGQVYFTNGVSELGLPFVAAAVRAVRKFETFDAAIDPYGEHDFGSVVVAGRKLFWKLDYYDRSQQCGSNDPADPSQTTRVLTIMLADEY